MPHFIWLLMAALLASCDSPAFWFGTGRMSPQIEIIADGSGVSRVRVGITLGDDHPSDYIVLSADDHFVVTVDGKETKLTPSGRHYEAIVPTEAAGTEFTVALHRDLGESAIKSTVSLPPPFEMDVTQTEVSYSKGSISYTWRPIAEGNIGWEVRGSCVVGGGGSTTDDGQDSFRAVGLRKPDMHKDDVCTVDLIVSRFIVGSLDPAFSSTGIIVARQIRKDSFLLSP